jgi:hypothetical protein
MFFSKDIALIEPKLCINHWKVLYKLCVFYVDRNFHFILLVNQRLSRACIVHLVIKRTNWSYVKTMSCSGSHHGIPFNIKNTKFVKDLPMIDAQFRSLGFLFRYEIQNGGYGRT